MSPHRSLLPLLALLPALAACGGSPTASGGAATLTRLVQDSLTLARVGQTAAVVASVDGVTAERVTLTVERETRWIADRAVLDGAALAAGEVRAGAPGTAVLSVRAPGAEPARLVVDFRPTRPLVTEARGTADGAVELLGYRLDAAQAEHLEVDGVAAPVVARDSATLRIALPAPTAASCSEAPAASRISLPGADVDGSAVFPARGVTEVRLGVGERVALPAGPSGCIRFAREAGAAYALAFLDTRFLAAAETGYEGAATGPATYVVSVAETGSTAPAASRAPSPARSWSRVAAPEDGHRAAAGAATDPRSPFLRATPWQVGERVVLSDAALGGEVAVRIAAVHDRLVLAVAEGEDAATAEWVARADTALAWMAAQGVPLLRAALGEADAVTSPAAGQLLVVARADNGARGGSSVSTIRGGRRHTLALLNTRQGASAVGVLRTLAHELGHAWQGVYDERTRPAGTPLPTLVPLWASEGSADLLAGLVVRRVLGVGLLANWEWAASLPSGREMPYALLAAGARGELTAGYASAAGFQLDLVTRLVRHGVAEEEAVAEVVRGALEGWHGHDAAGLRREGLAARMRRRLGTRWDPAEALLLWAASQATDDLTASPELQNPVFRAISTSGRERDAGWLAPAVLRTGGAAAVGHAASSAVVRGNAATLAWRYGSPNYFLVEDGGRGGTYRLGAGWNGLPLERTAWMVVRYR